MKCWIVSILALIYIIYVVVGGLIFMVLERDREADTKVASGNYRDAFLANHNCVTTDEFNDLVKFVISAYQEGVLLSNDTEPTTTWTPHTSIYFATTVVTTIGYGNISPTTSGGRVFCVFFAIFGIPLALVLLAQLGIKLTEQTAKLDAWMEKKMSCGCAVKHPKIMKAARYTVVHLIGLIFLMLIPAAIFSVMETDWSYGIGIYYSVITLTTIGFGDYVAGFNDVWGHPLYRIMIAFWIVIGLAWMSSLIAGTQEVYDSRISKAEKKSVNPEKDDPEKGDPEKGKDDNKTKEEKYTELERKDSKINGEQITEKL